MQRDEFERLALAELDTLCRFAHFLTRDSNAADDLVQEVYARAFRAHSIEAFESRGKGMRAWLMTIARTSFYGRLEHEWAGDRAMAARADQADSDERAGMEPPDPETASAIDWGKIRPALQSSLDALSSELRETLWFWAIEGMKYREIAEALDLPIGTVMSRLHRARAQMARLLSSDASAAAEINEAGFEIQREASVRPGGMP